MCSPRYPQSPWRYGILVGITAAAGLLAGAVAAALSPVTVTSTALVLLPQAAQTTAAAARGEPSPFTATQEVVAGSDPVLSRALPDARPAMSLAELRHDIQIRSLTPPVISVSAKGKTACLTQRQRPTLSPAATSGTSVLPAARWGMCRRTCSSWPQATGTAPLMRLLAGAMLGTVSGVLAGAIPALWGIHVTGAAQVSALPRKSAWPDRIPA